MLSLALCSFLSIAAFLPGERVLLDAHNAYPYQGHWSDRLERALSTGLPIAIEQDLVWRDGKPIVSHGKPFTGDEPTLESHFFERVRPLMEQALREGRDERWPLLTLNLDFKTNEAEHHRAIWNLLGKYESWLTTARDGELRVGPLLVLTGEDDSQEKAFGSAPVLRLFGAVHTIDGRPGPKTGYRRWWNLPWRAIEPEGQKNAGNWSAADEQRLRSTVHKAHGAGLWIRLYTLNGHDSKDRSGGWHDGYNFGSLGAAQVRWRAAIRAGVDFVAVDQYEEFAALLRSFQTITGRLSREDYERFIEHGFDVPPGTKRINVWLDYTGVERRTVIDLGLRGPAGFRGWSGGGPQAITVGQTLSSFGYLPGPIEAGRWAVVLGIPNIREGSKDRYRITVETNKNEEPHFPVLREAAGWYVGDFHSHSGHSDGRAIAADGSRLRIPVHRIFDAARSAGLDFVALSDHNTTAHWNEVERLQPYYESVLLLHAREVTTYSGHINAFGERRFIDFRIAADRSMLDLLSTLRWENAVTSINHPVAPDDERCMGCGWSAVDDATMRQVDAVEIVNGPHIEGAVAGWSFWASMLNRGMRLTAIGGSDDHTADESLDRKIGVPATVVGAAALSEPAIIEGIRSGRAYVRTRGPAGPRLTFGASAGAARWEMGDVLPATLDRIALQAGVTGGGGQTLVWIRNGDEIGRKELSSESETSLTIRPSPGDWYSVVIRDSSGPTAISNAIYVAR